MTDTANTPPSSPEGSGIPASPAPSAQGIQAVAPPPVVAPAVAESPVPVTAAPAVATRTTETVVIPPAPVVAGTDEVVLFIASPWWIGHFDPSVAGCPVIDGLGVAVPTSLADQAISVGTANGITIERRVA